MTIEDEIEKAVQPLSIMAGTAPHWVGMILVVLSFVVYLWTKDQQEIALSSHTDHINAMRIDQCHDIQVQAANAMVAMAEAMQEQSEQFKEFTRELEHHNREKR